MVIISNYWKTRKFDFWWFFLPWQMLGIVHLISVRSWANLNFFRNSAVIPQIPSIFHLLHLTVTPYLIQSPLSSFLYHSHCVLRLLPSCLTYDSVDSLLRSARWSLFSVLMLSKSTFTASFLDDDLLVENNVTKQGDYIEPYNVVVNVANNCCKV